MNNSSVQRNGVATVDKEVRQEETVNMMGLSIDAVKVLDAALEMCQSRISETTDVVDPFNGKLIPMWREVQVLRKIVNSVLSGEYRGFQS